MAEIRRGIGTEPRNLERLPWLEPVEDEDDYSEEGGGRRLLVVLGSALLAVAVIAGLLVTLRHWRGAHADIGGIISAPTGAYKVRPANPGGLAVDSAGTVAEQTGTGSDIDAPLALVTPEQPMVGPGHAPPAGRAPDPALPPRAETAPAIAAPAAATPAKGNATAAVAATPITVVDGGTIQLGAFSSEAKAHGAWKSLARRFTFLQPMTPEISAVTTGDATLYRLRASGGGPAAQLCAKLRVAGETCGIVG